MDTQVVVAVAQILTSIATLMLASFLAAQLMIQRKQLAITHRDSYRELAFASRTRTQELTLAQITNESLLSTYEKAKNGLEKLDEQETRQFFGIQRELFVQLLTEWSLAISSNVEHLNVEYFKGRLGIIMGTDGERQYYANNGRVILSILETTGELMKLGDIVYEELTGSPVPT